MPEKGVLTIDDPEAVELAAEVERLSGRSIVSIVKDALRREAELLRPAERVVDLDEVRRIQEELRSWPVVDPRSPDELIGYNEDGLFD